MVKCEICRRVWEEDELREYTQDGESFSLCPYCGGDVFEVAECLKCGKMKELDDLTEGLCEDCIISKKDDVDFLVRSGSVDPEEIKINSFLSWFFTKDEIEEILIKELKEAIKQKGFDFTKYIESDLFWFAEFIRKEEKL